MVVLTERFQRALVHAATAHACQVRKGTEIPYVSHLLAVAGLVLENGGSETEAIAALLHDAVEDAGGAMRREMIRVEFGEEVAAIVSACSDTDTFPKPPWRERKEAYIAAIPHESRSARLVSAADKLHNARCVVEDYRRRGESLWTIFKGGREGTLWFYRAVVDALLAVEKTPLVEELDRVVAELERLAAANDPQPAQK